MDAQNYFGDEEQNVPQNATSSFGASNNMNNEKILRVFFDIFCPKCGIGWDELFVPEFCPECGTKVTDTPGEGFSWGIKSMKRIKAPFPTFNCTRCNLVIPKAARQGGLACPRCYTPFDEIHKDSRLPGIIKFLISKISGR